MGRKMDALMGKAFRSSKCKTLLKLTIARLKILRNKRELQCKQLRKDVAQLLQNGQEASARLRVEHIFREQNILDAYLLIGGYSETVSERMMSIKMQKTCPNDLKESIASLVFAAPRCADLPELQDVRSLFAAKYGKEFTEAAVELRPDCGVNKRIIEKLSTRVPSPEAKVRLMKEIASENGIEWNFEETETRQMKTAEDSVDGSKKYSETKHPTSIPKDGTNEPVKKSSLSSKGPDAARQQAPDTYFSRPAPTTPRLDVSTKGEQEFHSSTKQGYGETSNADIYNSNSLHDPLHFKEESVVSPNSDTDVDPNISEFDLYARKRMEGKMGSDISTENAAAYENSSSSDTHHDFVKFAKKDEMSADLRRESIEYTDVASAAQAAFESAAYAAAAARAAVELSKVESRNKKFNHKANDSREEMPESEVELDKVILREQKEEKYAMPHAVGSGIEDTFSTRNVQAIDIKSPRTRIGENDVFSTGIGFEKTHHDEKEVSDSESAEEASEDEAAWSKEKRSHASKSSQEHLRDYSDGQEEYETNALSIDRKLNNQNMNIGGIEPKFKRSVSGSTSNSSEQSFSNKASRPLFDDYGDDEIDFENTTPERPSYQSMPTPHRRPGTEDTQLKYAHYTSNQRQIDDYDENDGYEKGTDRKEYKNQDSTPRTLGPTKLSYGDFVPKEKYSLESFELESEDEMETLNADSGVKSQSHTKMSVLSSQPDAIYQSPHGMPREQRIEGTVSADQSAYPGYRGNYRNYEPPHGIKSHYSDSQDSDDEGVYRYEGDGKLRWRPTNFAEQRASVASHKSLEQSVSVASHKSLPVNTRMSVRTRR